MEVGEMSSMAVLTDAVGATIGAWQPVAHHGFGILGEPGAHHGFGILGEPGTPNWFELHTRDHAAAVKFYEDVFGWDTHVASDAPDFRYTTLGEGESQLAGIMDATAFLPGGAPAHWSIYFGVTDADAALTKIVELGGAVVLPAEDTPFGRLATAGDPTGAVFKLVAGS
jgi:predicted enzyme related to lactoylglutathione lyase